MVNLFWDSWRNVTFCYRALVPLRAAKCRNKTIKQPSERLDNRRGYRVLERLLGNPVFIPFGSLPAEGPWSEGVRAPGVADRIRGRRKRPTAWRSTPSGNSGSGSSREDSRVSESRQIKASLTISLSFRPSSAARARACRSRNSGISTVVLMIAL